jgi:hypothetical protein
MARHSSHSQIAQSKLGEMAALLSSVFLIAAS